VSLFRRRKETLNERLMREAGLEPATVDDEPRAVPEGGFDPVGAFRARLDPESRAVLFRNREWEVVTTAEAPNIEGDEVEFAALPDGSLLVDEEQGDADLGPLADAVEAKLEPPYRAKGVRRSEAVWGVAANRIQVVRMDAEGDEVDLTLNQGERELRVDGLRSTRALPELERLAERESRDYVVHAERLDGDLWEVRVSPL
jgi:hypothetical protein